MCVQLFMLDTQQFLSVNFSSIKYKSTYKSIKNAKKEQKLYKTES